MPEILIGTSGYDHPELKGSFYPSDLPRKDFLLYYSTKFNALEINSTFYGMPTGERLLSFWERSEGRLKFSIKTTRVLTHEIDRQWKNYAEEFRKALSALQEKNALSSVLVQFPESFHYNPENRFYLSDLMKSFENLPVVIEFRHKTWLKASVFEGLEKRNSGIVFCDMPQCASTYVNLFDTKTVQTPFIGNTAYIRFHGRNANGWYAMAQSSKDTPRYDYNYSLEELKSFVPIIKLAQSEGKTIQLYFNNHPKGTGFKNALELQNLLLT